MGLGEAIVGDQGRQGGQPYTAGKLRRCAGAALAALCVKLALTELPKPGAVRSRATSGRERHSLQAVAQGIFCRELPYFKAPQPATWPQTSPRPLLHFAALRLLPVVQGDKFTDSGMTPYGCAKLWMLMFAEELQRRLRAEGGKAAQVGQHGSMPTRWGGWVDVDLWAGGAQDGMVIEVRKSRLRDSCRCNPRLDFRCRSTCLGCIPAWWTRPSWTRRTPSATSTPHSSCCRWVWRH